MWNSNSKEIGLIDNNYYAVTILKVHGQGAELHVNRGFVPTFGTHAPLCVYQNWVQDPQPKSRNQHLVQGESPLDGLWA